MGLKYNHEEGQTPISEDEMPGLKVKSITLQRELDEFELLNITKAKIWLKKQKLTPEAALSEAFLKKLHKKMFGDVWKWAGVFRRSEKNIGVSWVMIGRELRILLDDTLFWIENETFPPAEIALRFKHRLVSIHCFPNGNGRHSRIMADVLMENVFGQTAFSWRAAGMVSASEERRRYIAALRAADGGDYGLLLDFAG
ncbi:mobile mystery protein B [Neolewinella agarilytica]|uniref:Mobile mystery protein B n=1 Tax=Neolewinella agarilytica TaxID=478744 RepID=A0A1H9EYA1_9BACT|nr:mobile mystery protein B [Neolewinella agarilytica]SEQ30183.1 mobile mystery protein B [Neolewinella agarilytica]